MAKATTTEMRSTFKPSCIRFVKYTYMCLCTTIAKLNEIKSCFLKKKMPSNDSKHLFAIVYNYVIRKRIPVKHSKCVELLTYLLLLCLVHICFVGFNFHHFFHVSFFFSLSFSPKLSECCKSIGKSIDFVMLSTILQMANGILRIKMCNRCGIN